MDIRYVDWYSLVLGKYVVCYSVNDINLIPNVSFFEMFRQGFMTLSNVVHLTCYVGDAATTIELLTPM